MNPHFKVEGNKLTSLQGEVSTFFELVPSDLEGLSDNQIEQVFLDLENDLKNTKQEIKIFKIAEKIYLNSFDEISLGTVKIIPKDNPLETFLGNSISDIIFKDNYFVNANEFGRVLTVKDYPAKLARLSSLNWPDFVFNFQKIERNKAKKSVHFKRKLHFSALHKSMKDIESENAYKEAEDIYDDLLTDTRSLLKAELFFILKGRSLEELNEKCQEFCSSFKGEGGNLITETFGLSYFFKHLLPGIKPSFKRSQEMTSDYLSYLMPLHQDFVMSEGMRLKSLRGKDVFLDFFSESSLNYNILITGSSGQGKSMLTGKILKHELEEGTKILVLDLGNSFSKNAKFHAGEILSLKFNPLQFKDPRYLKEFILSAISKEESLSKKEEGKLYSLLKDLVPEFQGNFMELIKVLENDFHGLGFYFKELEEYFSSEQATLHAFTYCNFDSYPQNMKSPLIIYLIEYFKSLEGKKVFIFDECWHLLSQNAEYIAECFRTFRKYQASAVAISQNLDDFSETQLGRVIIQNTYLKFLFKQNLKISEFIDEQTLSLVNTIQSKKGEFSEFLLLSESFKKPLRYYPDPLEYELFSSDREDIRKFDAYLEDRGKYLEFPKALINYVLIKNPRWSAHEQIS